MLMRAAKIQCQTVVRRATHLPRGPSRTFAQRAAVQLFSGWYRLALAVSLRNRRASRRLELGRRRRDRVGEVRARAHLVLPRSTIYSSPLHRTPGRAGRSSMPRRSPFSHSRFLSRNAARAERCASPPPHAPSTTTQPRPRARVASLFLPPPVLACQRLSRSPISILSPSFAE